MQIGTVLNEAPLPQLIEAARKIEASGLSNIWMANIFGYDAISILAILGRETQHIGLGSAVTPTYPRHPTAIAQQAITTAAVTNNRFTLGIGLSHKLVIEDMFGMSYDKPAKHMREYLSVLMPLARGETANFEGEQYKVRGVNIAVPGAERLPVVIAGLGPVMLKLAGEMTDGTSTWMVGPKTMVDHIVPGLGRDDATVVAGVPIALTTDVEAAREKIAKDLHPGQGRYGKRGDKLFARAGQDRCDLGAAFAQTPDQIEGFIGGNAAADDQQDPFSGKHGRTTH